MSRESMFKGVSVKGDLCKGRSLSRGSLSGETPSSL